MWDFSLVRTTIPKGWNPIVRRYHGMNRISLSKVTPGVTQSAIVHYSKICVYEIYGASWALMDEHIFIRILQYIENLHKR